MAKFDASEYERSDYENYLKLRGDTKGLLLHQSKCSAQCSESDKTIELFVDPFFAEYFNYENDRIGPGMTQDFEQTETDVDESNEVSVNKELLRLCQRFQVEFYDVEGKADPKKVYDHNYYANALSGAKISYHLGEGLLDFFYFDIKKHIGSLRLMMALLSMEGRAAFAEIANKPAPSDAPVKVKNEEDYLKFIRDRWRITHDFCSDFFYSSLYTAAFPPVFVDAEQKTFTRYITYVQELQKEFQEKLTFCFDPDFYPKVLGHLYPHERYLLYCRVYKEYPIPHTRKEEVTIGGATKKAEKMPFDCTQQYVFKRLSYSIDTTTDEYKEFTEKYCHGRSCVEMYTKIPHCIKIRYKCNSIYDMLSLEFTKMLESNIRLRKCKRCGKFFIMKGNYDTNYCDRVAEGQTRSCQELAAQENYKAKASENPALAIYSKYYKRYAARVRVRQIKEADFKKWKFQALSKRDACTDGKITIEEYVAWLESCFPNRKSKT